MAFWVSKEESSNLDLSPRILVCGIFFPFFFFFSLASPPPPLAKTFSLDFLRLGFDILGKFQNGSTIVVLV